MTAIALCAHCVSSYNEPDPCVIIFGLVMSHMGCLMTLLSAQPYFPLASAGVTSVLILQNVTKSYTKHIWQASISIQLRHAQWLFLNETQMLSIMCIFFINTSTVCVLW